MTLIPVRDAIAVSNSEVQCFKRCRRKWWLTYHLKLQPKRSEPTGARALGNLLHGALEVYYKNGQDGGLAMAHITTRLAAVLEVYPEEEREIIKAYDYGVAMLEGYLEWLAEEGADAELEVVGVELTLTAPSPEPRYTLLAKLDLLVRQLGFLGPMDHKSSASLSELAKTAHMQEQALWYQLLSTLLGDADPIAGMIFNQLKKSKRTARAKPPFYARLQVHHNQGEIEMFWQRLFGVLRVMHCVEGELANGVHPVVACYPTPAQDCTWSCDFFRVCPLLDDPNSDAAYLLENNYETGDPYARYGEGDSDADPE